MQFSFRILGYYFIVTVLASISAVLTYHGLLSGFGRNISLAFAAVIGVWLLLAHHEIHRERVKGRSMLPGLGLLASAAIVSFASNFNTVYTNWMQQDLAAATVVESHELFRQNLTNARTALENNEQMERARREKADFDRELVRLRIQVLDPNNPGVGEKAQEHIDNIHDLLGGELTDLRRPSSDAPVSELINWYETFKQAAEIDFAHKAGTTAAAEIGKLIDLINQNLSQFEDAPRDADRNDLTLLQEFSTRSQEIERRANALLPPEERVTSHAIDFMGGRLGELTYTLKNGFVERPNPSATIVSSVVSLLVDAGPLILALVMFRPVQNAESEPLHRRRWRRKRGSGGLT